MSPSDLGRGRPPERHHHRDVQGGWLRPAVFGVMDGLVSNFALIAGLAGGQAPRQVIVLAGLAGLASGAFSMGVGEYVSVASQSELAEAEIEVERRELETHPAAERAELAARYEERGLSPELAAEVAAALHRDPAEALEVHAREELGVVPGELPSPWLAAFSSFASFSIGAILPVLPYLLGTVELWPAALVAALGLFSAGMLVSKVTARSWWFSGLRQLSFGAAAALLTYGIGVLIGVSGL
ncbi:VIT1/CCC1 transporter family protein [Actinocorallia populi]|uniref:VIT1/CCC1 transporter family protein n=1 Tax=Actinocorallia populi TaxID=2079200 RepID=UPI001E4049B5|nr:VIT1/CCC1 transporter family protein [Actinocorallia populi]